MDFTQVIALIVLVFAVLLFVFRKKIGVYFTSLAYDYGVDALFSFADNFIYGIGLVGLDIGDWIAASLIFARQKKITGGFVAFIVAWEAANFLPMSLIPGIGEAVEIFFNLFPAVTISYFLFNKENKAKELENNLIQEIGIINQSGGDAYKAKIHLAEAQKQFEEGNYAIAVGELKKANLSGKISNYINKFASYVDEKSKVLRAEASKAPSELKDSVEKAIKESEAFFEQISSSHSILEAINLARQGVTRIDSAESDFEKMFSSLKKKVEEDVDTKETHGVSESQNSSNLDIKELQNNSEDKEIHKKSKEQVKEEVYKESVEEIPEEKTNSEEEEDKGEAVVEKNKLDEEGSFLSKLSNKFSERFSKKP
jgi:hypothetical protein